MKKGINKDYSCSFSDDRANTNGNSELLNTGFNYDWDMLIHWQIKLQDYTKVFS